MLTALMAFEPRLVIILFPDGVTSNKGRPFANKCSMLSSSYRCHIYVDKLFIGEGRPTTVKLFVGHDMPSAVFNSLELAQKADELEGAVRVCFIQASKVAVAGYLVSSTKTLDVIHWTKHYNCHPRLLNMDIEVKNLNIKDPNGETRKWSPRNQVIAAHILCSEKNEKEANIQLGNVYKKIRKASRAAGELPEVRAMWYVPYKSTNIITQTPERRAKLQKNKLMHKWHLDQHHPITFWGLDNIYKILTTPNGAKFTICQIIISTKSVQDLITPLFVGVNVSPEGDVIIICDIGMKKEAEVMLSHFGIYIAVIFGSVVWEAFTKSYKTSTEAFQYYPVKNCAIKRYNTTIVSEESFDLEFTKCGFTDDVIEIPTEIEFDLRHQVTLHLCPNIIGLLGDENGDT